jgi:hypothetical protein
MKGYTSLKEYVKDYKMYLAAKRIDPGRNGETITSFFKQRMDLRMNNASLGFKKMLKNKGYTNDDLKIIATHDVIGEISELRDFIRVCFGDSNVSKYYKRLLSTKAFKNGRLKRIYEFIPLTIQTKRDFVEFIRSNRNTTKSELKIIMNRICEKNWRGWVDELLVENKLFVRRGCFYA